MWRQNSNFWKVRKLSRPSMSQRLLSRFKTFNSAKYMIQNSCNLLKLDERLYQSMCQYIFRRLPQFARIDSRSSLAGINSTTASYKFRLQGAIHDPLCPFSAPWLFSVMASPILYQSLVHFKCGGFRVLWIIEVLTMRKAFQDLIL